MAFVVKTAKGGPKINIGIIENAKTNKKIGIIPNINLNNRKTLEILLNSIVGRAKLIINIIAKNIQANAVPNIIVTNDLSGYIFVKNDIAYPNFCIVLSIYIIL